MKKRVRQGGSRGAVGRDYISPPWNFSWLVPKELCASARPDTEANVGFLRNEGVKVLVTLSEETPPHRSAHTHFHTHVIPIEEFEDPTMEEISQFISVCEKAREENKAVCVHCRMGRGRTGVMLACYLVKFHNQHPSSAVSNVRFQRPGSIETPQQERAVRRFWDYLAWGHE